MLKKTIIWLAILIWWLSLSIADEPGFEIIPWNSNSNIWNTVKSVGEWGKVRDNYKDRANSNMTLWDQFASGIMTWDTILDYAVYLVKFLWQLALLAGAIMIIYFGYKKATEHLKFWGTLWKVVIGILVISFAYVIVKIIWSAFIS